MESSIHLKPPLTPHYFHSLNCKCLKCHSLCSQELHHFFNDTSAPATEHLEAHSGNDGKLVVVENEKHS